MDLQKFHVVAVISNPARFKSRYDLFRKFKRHMTESGVQLHTVELATGHRPHEISTETDLQLRCPDELWHKENLINLGIQRLPRNWEYVAWIDADIEFARRDWALETVQQLQHHQVVQMWENAVDLGPTGQIMQTHTSFGSCYLQDKAKSANWKAYGVYPHTGFAWAARREALEGVGGLIDRAILGAGDHHMAWSMIGLGHQTLPGKVNSNYRKLVLDWQQRAERVIRRDVGYVPGTILHNWHGKKADRKYVERWSVLTDNNYDPYVDVAPDVYGVLRFNDDGSDRMRRLRDQIRQYMRQRNEDSVDLR